MMSGMQNLALIFALSELALAVSMLWAFHAHLI